ncbi:MAG: lysylphosphatidylglycerol synthase transmembrane domain-containing protein [Acidobacteriota bacterium]
MRSLLTWTAKILISGGLLYWLLSKIDRGQLWHTVQNASLAWLAVAMALYVVVVLISSWRWHRLLEAQHVHATYAHVTGSFLVATFFNNFLPSNIGGDVIRIRDTAEAAGSKTRAATIVLLDRAIGMVGLASVAALAATVATELGDNEPFNPIWLWIAMAAGAIVIVFVLFYPKTIGTLLRPLKMFHQEWVSLQISRLVHAMERFAQSPWALVQCFAGALAVQAVIVGFYAATAYAMHIPMPAVHLAVLIPMSFVVQMLPLSVNGFGVRESIFVFYFARLGLPKESAIALSFLGQALIMLFSMSGAVVMALRKKPTTVSGT